MALLVLTLISILGLIFMLKTGTAGVGGLLVERESQPLAFGVACLVAVIMGAGGIIGALAEILH